MKISYLKYVLVLALTGSTLSAQFELLALYDFESDLSDSTGGNDLVNRNGFTPSFTTGLFGGSAMELDGDERMHMSNYPTKASFNGVGLSFAGWFNLTEGQGGRVFSQGVSFGTLTTVGWQVDLNRGADAIEITVRDTQDDRIINHANADFDTGQWNHIAGSWNGSSADPEFVFYFNGNVISHSYSLIGGTFDGLQGSNVDLMVLSGGLDSGGADRSFDGLVDDLRFYTGVISASEVVSLSSVPEPSSYALILGLLALSIKTCARGRRAKRKHSTNL